MAPVDRLLKDVWVSLQRQNRDRRDALRAVVIKNLRGIQNLRVSFPYPVCVLAGPNGCGKSTVLFACACAYKNPSHGPSNLTPSIIFPDFINRQQAEAADLPGKTELEFDYLQDASSYVMVWKRGKSWNRSYKGRPGGKQPQRKLYMRTLANLTNPAEVRSFLQLGRQQIATEYLADESLAFASRILPQDYKSLALIKDKKRDLLFTRLKDSQATGYSEFHMSAGERAVLRFSKDLAGLRNALVLIDEIEAGLHPYTQQRVMLELQRIALRQHLQIIVASHSTVVLDSVPPEARIFLERDATTGNVQVIENRYKDVLQKALYGQSHDKLSILCEDEIAAEIVRGVLDTVIPTFDPPLAHDDFVVGRDTSKDKFAVHAEALGKFDRLGDCLMVLDGDARQEIPKIKAAGEDYGYMPEPLALPGSAPPEQWIWSVLKQHPQSYGEDLGLKVEQLQNHMAEIEQIYQGHLQSNLSKIWKDILESLAEKLWRTPEYLARRSGYIEATAQRGPMLFFKRDLLDRVNSWRRRHQL